MAFYDHFLLKMTHMPHTKKGTCILDDKDNGKDKIYFVEVLVLTSAVFCESTLAPGIRACYLYLNLFLKSLLYTQEMKIIIARLATEMISVLYQEPWMLVRL